MLEGHFFSVDLRRDHLAVVRGGGRLHDDEVAVCYQSVDHGIALDPNREHVRVPLCEEGGQVDGLVCVASLACARNVQRLACGDAPNHGDGVDVLRPCVAAGRVLQNLDASGDLGLPPNVPLALENPQIVVDDRSRTDATPLLDIADGRGVLVVAQELLNELEDPFLPLGQVLLHR